MFMNGIIVLERVIVYLKTSYSITSQECKGTIFGLNLAFAG